MCGLVGVAGKIGKKEKDAFTMMLHLDIIRGKHSTGVASIKAQGDWGLVKKKGTAWDLFDSREFDNLMLGTTYCLIGHNRAATKGKVNNINAHPFEFEDVVGAHNGTLRGQHYLPDYKEFEVDSENIFHSIQQIGLEDTLDKLDGAYALSFWDKRDEELVLLRNNERTLHYALSEDGETLFWASESWMISIACSRNGIKFKDTEALDVCTIYRFKFDRKYKTDNPVQVDKTPFKEFRPPKAYSGYTPGKGVGALPAPAKESASTGGNTRLRVDPFSLVGKVVEFTLDDAGTSALGASYITCRLVDDPNLLIRFYRTPLTEELFHDMIALSNDTVFSGKVASYNGGLLYCDPRTIEEAVDEDDDSDDADWLFITYEGKEVNKETWIRMTKKGCCICSDTPDSQEADDIVWTSYDTFVCAGCKDLDFVKEYITQEM